MSESKHTPDIKCYRINYNSKYWANVAAKVGNQCSSPVGAVFAVNALCDAYEDIAKQRDELLSDLAEAKRSAEFNFEQYQDVGRLLHEECEKTEKLLAALEKCRKELSAWMRDHGDDIATQEAVADARAAIASVMGEQ